MHLLKIFKLLEFGSPADHSGSDVVTILDELRSNHPNQKYRQQSTYTPYISLNHASAFLFSDLRSTRRTASE